MKNVVNNILQLPTFCKPINRAIWSGGLGPEINEGVPEARIYHSRIYSSGQEIVLKRIGIRLGAGYDAAKEVQSPEVITALRHLYWVVPVLMTGVGVFCASQLPSVKNEK